MTNKVGIYMRYVQSVCPSVLLSMKADVEFTHLTGMGAAALTLVLVEPFLVPNFSCLLRTSRGGLATEFT